MLSSGRRPLIHLRVTLTLGEARLLDATARERGLRSADLIRELAVDSLLSRFRPPPPSPPEHPAA